VQLDDLNPEQREAVLATDGPVLVLAGAGSGKTRVITYRIAHLIAEKGVAGEHILAVTFTNKAAQEMRERVQQLVREPARHCTVATFHSLCVRILRREWQIARLPQQFAISDESDQLSIVRKILAGAGIAETTITPKRLLSLISRFKLGDVSATTPVRAPRGWVPLALIAEQYDAALRSAQALDFDDLLIQTVKLFNTHADCLDRYRRRFTHILVDEYQDTNAIQYRLIHQLAGTTGNLTVVGDEDQAIYSWRGATIRNILDFEKDFSRARVFHLHENYRSRPAILAAAAQLVANNEQRRKKALRAIRAEGEPVVHHEAQDEQGEARFVVEHLRESRSTASAAILFRTNAQSRVFEDELRQRNIPYKVIGSISFYDRSEIKTVLAYLRLILNPHDDLAFARVVNMPPRGVGERSLALLRQLAQERSASLWDGLELQISEHAAAGRAQPGLRAFQDLIARLRARLGEASLTDFVAEVVAASGLEDYLKQDKTERDRLENIGELVSAARQYEERAQPPTLAGFIDELSLTSSSDERAQEMPVVLMTLHAAKGLEFDMVFLVGLEEGLLPHSQSTASPAQIEEERRLCYVGMTRARERLYLSWARSRLLFGSRKTARASRFLEEIGGQSFTAARLRQQASHRPAPRTTERAPIQPKQGKEDEARAVLRPGQIVRHPSFGVGTILRREGNGEDAKLTVAFARAGSKRLLVKYAQLELA
jgi:DNA helicase-2/ATP-dependent DNA helicase PcrA